MQSVRTKTAGGGGPCGQTRAGSRAGSRTRSRLAEGRAEPGSAADGGAARTSKTSITIRCVRGTPPLAAPRGRPRSGDNASNALGTSLYSDMCRFGIAGRRCWFMVVAGGKGGGGGEGSRRRLGLLGVLPLPVGLAGGSLQVIHTLPPAERSQLSVAIR